MKAAQLREKSNADLTTMLHEQRKRLSELRFTVTSGKVKNIKELHEVKKTIARILMLLAEK